MRINRKNDLYIQYKLRQSQVKQNIYYFSCLSSAPLFNILMRRALYNQVRIIMGLLGNKDTKAPAKESVLKAPQNPPPAVIAPEGTDFKTTLEGWVGSTKSFFNSWTSQACQLSESETAQDLKKARKEFYNNFCHPLGNLYRELPVQLTSWKFRQTERYSQRERLLTLQGVTLLVAVSSLLTKKDLGFSKRFLFSVRNSGVAFLLGGLLIVPEIYNPLIKSDF